MSEIRELSSYILKNAKKSFISKKCDNGKYIQNIANYGLNKGQKATVMRKGEYNGLSIEVLTDVKPLLTSMRIIRIIKFIAESNLQYALKTLNISEINSYNLTDQINIMYGIIKLWFDKNEIKIPDNKYNRIYNEIINNAINNDNITESIKTCILKTRSDLLDCKFKIINVGSSKKGNSVVPLSWLGRIFNNANELHLEMDKLDWRKGKPPVKFCCTYGMGIEKKKQWNKKTENVLNYAPKIGISLIPLLDGENIILKKDIKYFESNKEYLEWLVDKDNDLDYFLSITKNAEKIVIISNLEIISQKPNYVNTVNVGILVSRMQKAIRRGRKCPLLLYESMRDLSKAKQYNLPEQQFIKISGSRQLSWRLYISIIEEFQPYLSDEKYFNLLEILLLSIIAQNDPDLQFSNIIINKLIYTALLIQHTDKINQQWNWRQGKLTNLDNIKLSTQLNETQSIENALKLSLKIMPMMSGDFNMISKGLDYMKKSSYSKLNTLTLEEIFSNSDVNIENESRIASYDMHCDPSILLDIQSAIPYIPNRCEILTTKEWSSFIWERSSCYNIRYKKHFDILNKITVLSKLDVYRYKILQILQRQRDSIKKENDKQEMNQVMKTKNKSFVEIKMKAKNDSIESRNAFLLIFGEKIRLKPSNNKKSIEVIVAGTIEKPCKIRNIQTSQNVNYLQGNDRYLGELQYVEFMNQNNIIKKLPNAPDGYEWIFNKNNVKINVKIVETDEKLGINKLEFYVDNIKIMPFDGIKLLKPVPYPKQINLIKDIIIKNNVRRALYKICNNTVEIIQDFENNKMIEFNDQMREINIQRNNNKDYRVFNWIIEAIKSNVPIDIWKNIIMKINNNHNDEIIISQVDRRGHKINDSVNYKYEGMIMRMLNMLSMLYPRIFIPKNKLKYKMNKNLPEYKHMYDSLSMLSFKMNTFNNNDLINKELLNPKHKKIIIKTKLWDHQNSTSERIFNDIIIMKRKGFGDASNVGAGKSLTALSVISKIHNHEKYLDIYKGFLILVPTTKLYKTWIAKQSLRL